MTGVPQQHDIMKHNIVFHNNDTSCPETTSSSNSRKRKQDFQCSSLETNSFGHYPIYSEPFEYHPFQHEKTVAQDSNHSFEIPVEPLVTRSTPPFQTFLPNQSETNSVGENQGLTEMMVDFDSLSQSKILVRSDLMQTTWETTSPIQSPTRFSPGTPGFFTPGFLESLQENEVYEQHPLNLDWNEHDNYDSMIVKMEQEKNLVSQSGESVTSFFTTDQENDRPILSRRSLGHDSRIKTLVQTYLVHSLNDESVANLGEKTVIVLTSKVAQKSYGTEKRFLCPPPTAILVGTSWWTAKEKEDNNEILRIPGMGKDLLLGPPKLSITISGENSTQGGQVEWYTVSGATVGQTGHFKPPTKQESTTRFRSSESRHPPVELYNNDAHEPLAAGKSVSKHLYINDADEKRKRVECLIKLKLANGIQMSTIASKPIKVISKPSKKRQSVKNMELCIHHGTTVSLFNRIRSQTVSTKYLGVSTNTPLSFPGIQKETKTGEGTCFVARMNCWDPFVIWIVDPSSSEEADPQIYPPPPAIALKNKTGEPVPIHYNQPIVLQCLTTGLVSPVMIIRKVDRASTVVGGAQAEDEIGDEVLGDPVSQLHKIALQIVQDPSETSHTYLACLNDIVGMHKTTNARKPFSKAHWEELFDVTSQEGGKVIRKRRVSVDPVSHPPEKLMSSMSLSDHHSELLRQQELPFRRRVNSLNEDYGAPHQLFHPEVSRKSSISSSSSTPSIARRSSSASTAAHHLGAYWSEDVSDAAVWTIVGTDCATFTFWSPFLDDPSCSLSLNPLPSLSHYFASTNKSDHERILTMHGENFSRDLEVWFGDVKATYTEYRSRELIICKVPSRQELQQANKLHGNIPILLVRGDSTICKTGKHFPL